MRIVFDTNVLLSAAFFPGVCQDLLERCLVAPTIEVVLSEHILGEFLEHGTGKLHGREERVRAFVAELLLHCDIVAPTSIPADAVGDPDDLPVLGTAIAGGAEFLVTGDRELLALGTYRSVSILSPRVLRNRLRGD